MPDNDEIKIEDLDFSDMDFGALADDDDTVAEVAGWASGEREPPEPAAVGSLIALATADARHGALQRRRTAGCLWHASRNDEYGRD